MALTIDCPNRRVTSDSSITDLVALHKALRTFEASEDCMPEPENHTWAALPLGGGAYAYTLQMINGFTLHFAPAGDYEISGGNFIGTITADPGSAIERKSATSYVASTAQNPWDATAEGAYTYGQLLKLQAAILAGKTSGQKTSPVFRNVTDTADAAAATVDTSGNRTSITIYT